VWSLLGGGRSLLGAILLVCSGPLAWTFELTAGRMKRRLEQEVVAQRYRVCLTCAYGLGCLPREYQCPRCGTPYASEDLERAWKKWFGHASHCASVGSERAGDKGASD